MEKKCFIHEIESDIRLLEIYKLNIKAFERMNIYNEKNIQNLVHFTKLESLENILEYGLLSNNILENDNIDYSKTDDMRLDGKTDYICTSISFPNYKMFYYKRCTLKGDWAVIRINLAITIQNLDTLFYKYNAASSKNLTMIDRTSNEYLKSLFDEENRQIDLPINYTTNPQSEVLIKDWITTKAIIGIDVDKNNDMVKSLATNSHIDYNVSSELFNPREDYARWR